jgi:putative Mg2+ transporter-C (MgtC) family protein
MDMLARSILNLALAIFVGGLIGAEREFRDKAAGFRTIIFITLGSTLFTMLSMEMGGATDSTRIAANIVTGIGFLGAGAIIREQGSSKVTGMTTAATIWLAAALGMSIGAGEYAICLLTTCSVLLVLWVFPYIERWIGRFQNLVVYSVTLPVGVEYSEHMDELCSQCQLKAKLHKRTKSQNEITWIWHVFGRPAHHSKFVDLLIIDKDIKELKY